GERGVDEGEGGEPDRPVREKANRHLGPHQDACLAALKRRPDRRGAQRGDGPVVAGDLDAAERAARFRLQTLRPPPDRREPAPSTARAEAGGLASDTAEPAYEGSCGSMVREREPAGRAAP